MSLFEKSLLVFGVMLIIGSLAAKLAHRSFVSLTALFALVGLGLGASGLDLLAFSPDSPFVKSLAVVALVVILFRDGLEVDHELTRSSWHMPFRSLIVAMPITALIIALLTHALTGLNWLESFLVGALLSPTDPVLSSGVVTNPRVPEKIRNSLNLESGLNDGLALPAVLALTAAISHQEGFVWWEFLLKDLSLGFLVGVSMGIIMAYLAPRSPASPNHIKSLFAIGFAFASYGLAVSVHGNGLIAVFVGAIVFGIKRPDIRLAFEETSMDIVELIKLAIFVVFGAALTISVLSAGGLSALLIVLGGLLIARPVAIFMALAGTRLKTDEKLFISWFGPKGIATVAFSLLVLGEHLKSSELIFSIAALAVFSSVILHGLSDNLGAEWMAKRQEARVSTKEGDSKL